MLTNPYTPGAGFMPAYLAGRDDLILEAERCLNSIQQKYPQRSIIYYGLRGVGKTVLLNRIEMAADNLGILCEHIEAGDSRFSHRLTTAITRFLHEISTKEVAKDFVQKCMSIVKSFQVTYNVQENSFGVGLNSDVSFSSGVFSEDLTSMFVALGKAALKSDDTICLFIDEVQYLEKEEISGVITAIHRCNQLRLPIMVFCAGLPKIKKTVGEACSYAERLFKFQLVDALTPEQAKDAILQPALQCNVSYTQSAIDFIIEKTSCYPFFIQEFCNTIWINLENNNVKEIDLKHITTCEDAFINNLDAGFFSVRYDRCTPKERDFMIAMVKCDELPCSISNVAKQMSRSVSSISPIRGQLISKGMIYATGHAEIDFTVPKFDDFIKRVNPSLETSI